MTEDQTIDEVKEAIKLLKKRRSQLETEIKKLQDAKRKVVNAIKNLS